MQLKHQNKPINIWRSIILFGIPGLLMYLGLMVGMPYLQKLDFRDIFLFPFFLWLPIIPLLPVSIMLYNKEKKNYPGLRFSKRFRLKRMTGKDWLWALGGVVAVVVFDFIVMDPVSKWMASQSLFAAPDYFPKLFHPLKAIEFPIISLLGVPLYHNWAFLIITILLHSTAMVAEEFMWRGYILPKQEVTYGKYAWLVNGLLWAYLVHFVMKWNFISFLPSMLITPFIAQKTQSTWVSLMIHGIPNTALWLLILSGVLGAG